MKRILIALFSTASLVLFSEVPSHFGEIQAKRWQEMEAFVDLLRDGCGKPIDAKIKEVVIVLNLLGIETSQSCEGHLKWGLPFPWVDILPKNYFEIENQREEILKEIDEIEEEISQSRETISAYDLERLYIKYEKKRQENWKLFDLIKQCQFEQENMLWELLEEFYGKRDVFKEGTLIVQEGRLFSLGGFWQNRYTDEQKEKNLLRYQEEMRKFKEFLLIKYSKLIQ